MRQLSQRRSDAEKKDIYAHLTELKTRTLEVQSGVSEGHQVTDEKMIDSIEEHMGVYWDEIMACLLEEVVEEEFMQQERLDRIMAGNNKI